MNCSDKYYCYTFSNDIHFLSNIRNAIREKGDHTGGKGMNKKEQPLYKKAIGMMALAVFLMVMFVCCSLFAALYGTGLAVVFGLLTGKPIYLKSPMETLKFVFDLESLVACTVAALIYVSWKLYSPLNVRRTKNDNT